MSTRIDRISEEVQKAVAEAIRTVKDPRVKDAFISVVRCDVTNDLRYAKCYISTLGGNEKEIMKGLQSAAGYLRRTVGQRVQLRYAPELVFTPDHSITHGVHIAAVLSELRSEGKMGQEEPNGAESNGEEMTEITETRGAETP